MTNFARGQKAKLADLGCTGAFPVLLNMAGIEVDIACFGLDANDQLSDDRYMVFFNQKACPNNAVVLELGAGSASFMTDLASLPDSIHKLVFAASVSGEGAMRQLKASSMSLGDAVFAFSGADFQDEKAVIVGELYRRDGLWRFGAVGQGFNGGLSALLKHFGGTEAEASAPAPAPPPAKPVSLSKITLEKRGDKVSLEKNTSGGFGRIRVNLNWNQSAQPAEPSGFFNKLINKPASSNRIDLDLACLFQMADGTPGGVQALGNSWGSFTQPPFVHLEGDDRTGSNAGGENIFINGDQFSQIKRLLIFTFIYEGAPDWAATDGVVTIEVPGRAPVEVRLDQGSNASMCAIAMIENIGGNLQVTKLVEYFAQSNGKSAHEQVNDKFGFGLRFKKGSKD
ncbi:TerD family protein [Iodobacter fluviatilis]|uniref:General stress protein 16U n=1 Tax=Iodobacter fluviatilis TaxID=537 RepID=A0A377Q2H3_9NEIS|nr:TerD family protein [Iodobacter fluviatilis]TCU90010.1 tellurite resistance protein TerA [Iodobacter fluviatilis]STQ89037.1 General stress protein 16U [Iodobacter fluviatilis]